METKKINFKYLRNLMVETQIQARGISNKGVLDAMRKVERHKFVPKNLQDEAYQDKALTIGEGQTISQPYMVAIMTELLELTGQEKVLEIGTGLGYQTAILAELSRDVFTVERIKTLSDKAKENLLSLGYKNIHIIVGDGTVGLDKHKPFDRIIITAAAPDIPLLLIEEMKEGGILIAPIGERFSQILIKGRKKNNVLEKESYTPCTFVPLIGKYGWMD